MKLPAKHKALIEKLQTRYPFKLPLTYYYEGKAGNPEAREQKAFMHCLRTEFADILGYDTYTEMHKGKPVERETWRAVIVATADFYSASASRQMEQFLHMGYSPGTPDIVLLVKQQSYVGCIIEMKSLRGYASQNQQKTLSFLKEQGFSCHVCQGFLVALDVWLTYLGY